MKAIYLLCLIALSAWPATLPAAGDPVTAGDLFMARTRQLTFDGRRAGEGYFSRDGARMVFQSERDPQNPFFQIFELDLEQGDSRLVSRGSGKTTCAYYRGETREIVFASTHHDPRSAELQQAELDFRASGKQRRYDWDFDPQMELYLAPADGEPLRRLTDSLGYDAEASVAPDGQRIVFTSNRSAYAGTLDDERRKRIETDPAYDAEIYIMNVDGSGLRRLTETPGYDGGPFFTPDGERIVWRRFDVAGLIADVWTMLPDGTDPRQVTDFGCMSWAPYPHPSGEYFIFTSNKLGFTNFELFIVDVAGLKQPVRVTHTEGFDGLPVFAPDGRNLAWTTNRRGNGAQIFLARWDHAAASRALALAGPRVEAAAPEKNE